MRSIFGSDDYLGHARTAWEIIPSALKEIVMREVENALMYRIRENQVDVWWKVVDLVKDPVVEHIENEQRKK